MDSATNEPQRPETRQRLMPRGRFAGRSFRFYALFALIVQIAVGSVATLIRVFSIFYISVTKYTGVLPPKMDLFLQVLLSVPRQIPFGTTGLVGNFLIFWPFYSIAPVLFQSVADMLALTYVCGIAFLFAYFCRRWKEDPRVVVRVFLIYCVVNCFGLTLYSIIRMYLAML